MLQMVMEREIPLIQWKWIRMISTLQVGQSPLDSIKMMPFLSWVPLAYHMQSDGKGRAGLCTPSINGTCVLRSAFFMPIGDNLSKCLVSEPVSQRSLGM